MEIICFLCRQDFCLDGFPFDVDIGFTKLGPKKAGNPKNVGFALYFIKETKSNF